ncbi:GPI ethanolamine phosphate transferase 2-like [Mizuhopecten yessoensis]|uniref:GPI ethanolamine phosphate transferase 2 n=1 Tax=Mizuhopecten yessoensis TaxID=6573 RepID=A0A210Q042_MIZYE|nr:GPI ethanolamine phosphate transferase 2-like [Mizuhopecten yessoensis]OWF42123.1 GPI ethanolamine phosphate transferase 2 [Mizuhopecten yessoensis]
MDSSYIAYKFTCMLLLYAVFLKSFFPIRNGLPGFSEKSDFSFEIFNNNVSFYPEMHSTLKQPVFKKMVFILIDALRADFVFNKQSPMTSLQDLWTKGKLIRYIARVHPPTVTLPRIKALTTGSIPGFVDVVLNFGSSELHEDNIIDQMKRAGKRVMFYGDDTWIKLFPHHFVESDGTTSFFVTDYTEVDNNVTRHVLPALQAGQFDVLILHYLGLDHIGHLAGPTSSLVPPKLREMDSIIRDIYQHVEQNTEVDTLIVVCGDHGMSDQGGHGGATPSETRVPLLLLSPRFTHHTDEGTQEVDQVDVPPTLSVLLDLPIPRNNLGLIIDDALEGFSTEEKVMLLWKNALQVSKVLKYNNPDCDIDEGYVEFQRLSKAHHDWLMSRTSGMSNSDWLAEGDKIGRRYIKAINIMSENISSSLIQYDIYSLIVAVVTQWLILATLGLDLYLSPSPKGRSLSNTIVLSIPVTLTILLGHVMVCTTSSSGQLCRTDPSGLLLQSLILSVVCGSAAELVVIFVWFWSTRKTKVGPSGQWGVSCPLGVGLTLGTVSHTLSLLSSSYVEEEHQTWYYYTVTVHLAIVVLILRTCSSGVVTTHRPVQQPDPTQYQDLPDDKYSTNHREIEQKYSNDYKDTGHIDRHKEKERTDKDLEQVKGLHGHPVMAAILVLVLCRVLRTWNQTGNKWLEIPDVGDWLIRSENKCVLSVLVGGALSVVAMVKWAGQSCIQRFLFVLGLCFIYWYRVSTGAVDNPFQLLSTHKGTWLAQLVFVCIGLCMLHPLIASLLRGLQTERKPNPDEAISFCVSVQSGCILLVLLLSKPHNVAMFVMVVIQEHLIDSVVLRHILLSPTTVTLYYLWMGMAAFFYQGNSNSISTVDVSAGYTGLTDYQPVLVGLLIALSTYGGPVFWLVSLVKHLTATVDINHISFYTRLRILIEAVCGTLCWSRALPLAVYSGLVTLQRHHLFVWTVFSPKLLYEGVLTILLAAFSISCLFLVKMKI